MENIDPWGEIIDEVDPTSENTKAFYDNFMDLQEFAGNYYSPNTNGKLTHMVAKPRILGTIDTLIHLSSTNSAAVANNKPHLSWATDFGVSEYTGKNIFMRDPSLSTVALASAEPHIARDLLVSTEIFSGGGIDFSPKPELDFGRFRSNPADSNNKIVSESSILDYNFHFLQRPKNGSTSIHVSIYGFFRGYSFEAMS